MTVGLGDVSSKLGLGGEQEAEKYIRDMVHQNSVYVPFNSTTHIPSSVINCLATLNDRVCLSLPD